MSGKRKASKPGRSLMECERETMRVCLRLDRDTHALLCALAESLGCGLAQAATAAVVVAAKTCGVG